MMQQIANFGLVVAIVFGTSTTTTSAFTSPVVGRIALQTPRTSASASASALAASTETDVLVISPPGGIGEISAIEAARLGGSVKWFVVSAPEKTPDPAKPLSFTAETLAAITKSGGSMELAGATADSLLVPAGETTSNSNSALAAMTSWCTSPKSIICTYDGAMEEKKRVDRSKTAEEREIGTDNEVDLICRGVRVAAREIATPGATKIALLAAGEEINMGGSADGNDGKENGGGGLFAGLFGGNDVMEVPSSMEEALGGSVNAVIRYGELFGAPESSPESSPFMGGPRRDPTVREMYTQRSVRIDPTIAGGDAGSKSNRLALGEAASRLGLGKITSTTKATMDVSLSSFAGTDPPTGEEWNAEFERVTKMMGSGSSSSTSSAQLYRAEFSSVPSTKRLTEWIATKWAPAILRSYDIAGTRVGARPVYALQTSDTSVEIVWQELVDFNSVTSGKMMIEVDDNGLVASRGPGDASKGFGSLSRVPLPGEDILVRRLADAAAQAVEKGLAMKPQVAKKVEEAAPKKPVTTVAAVASVAAPAASSPDAAAGPGPRSAGARRSSERNRGSRRRKTSSGE